MVPIVFVVYLYTLMNDLQVLCGCKCIAMFLLTLFGICHSQSHLSGKPSGNVLDQEHYTNLLGSFFTKHCPYVPGVILAQDSATIL